MSRLVGSTYQYLQKSKIPTRKFQQSLFRLKIPKFDSTCQRYLAALDPIFQNDSRLGQTREITKKFQQGQGKELHSKLLQYDKTVRHSSYINEFWFHMYLASRVPLPLNYNPFLAWKDAPTEALNHQVVRSTNFLISAMRFKRSLEENLLEPEVYFLNPKTGKSNFYKDIMSWAPNSIATYLSFAFKAFPLDMSQYKNLFNSTRIPRLDKDEILKSDSKTNGHILVIKDGQFYLFDVLDQNGDLKTPEHIYANLHYIANQPKLVPKEGDHLSITELTTADRDVWAQEREHLINLSERNEKNLSRLDSALFAICLDDLKFKEPEQTIEAGHNFLHGSNQSGPLNRWFDKSFSLIITKDGHSCINFEHSWGDGVAILRFFNDTYNDSAKYPQITAPISEPDMSGVNVEKLDFDLDDRLRESIATSRKKHLEATSNFEMGAVQYEKLDKNYFKKNKLSPDAMSQLSFQLAFKKVYGKTPVTYESCSTAAFRGGRTETVRPCTNETNTAADEIVKKKLSNMELLELLKKSSAKHFQLCKEASMGDGFDRHLFALKEIALRNGEKLPEFYEDPIYKLSQHYTLSTSTLYGECFAGGGFAPVVPDGFGLGYGYVDKSFGVLVSSYKNHRNNTQFVQALHESLDDIRKIVET